MFSGFAMENLRKRIPKWIPRDWDQVKDFSEKYTLKVMSFLKVFGPSFYFMPDLLRLAISIPLFFWLAWFNFMKVCSRSRHEIVNY